MRETGVRPHMAFFVSVFASSLTRGGPATKERGTSARYRCVRSCRAASVSLSLFLSALLETQGRHFSCRLSRLDFFLLFFFLVFGFLCGREKKEQRATRKYNVALQAPPFANQ